MTDPGVWRPTYANCYARALRDLRDNNRDEFDEHLARHLADRDQGDLADELEQQALADADEIDPQQPQTDPPV